MGIGKAPLHQVDLRVFAMAAVASALSLLVAEAELGSSPEGELAGRSHLRRCLNGLCTLPLLSLRSTGAGPGPVQAGGSADQHWRGFAGMRGVLTLRGGLASTSQLLERLKVPLAFLGWYAMSIVYSLLNKEVLTVWQFPCIFSVVQLLVGSLWIGLLWMPLPTLGLRSGGRFAPIRRAPRLSRTEFLQVSQVAVWLALGHLMSTVAPAYGTVAFTNVVKTLEPLFTCAFSALFLKQVFAMPVYLSLVPVIAGVALASANEVSFSTISLVSGLLSNVCFALRAITAKRLMSQPVGDHMHAQNLYAVLTMQAMVAILPLALVAEGGTVVAGTLATIEQVGLAKLLRMLLLAGVSHYVYNECAFVALSSIHPVTHAVANTIKRIAVIVVSVLYFSNPLTPTGALGSAIAIVGVMLYSLAKAHDWSPSPPPSVVAAAPSPKRLVMSPSVLSVMDLPLDKTAKGATSPRYRHPSNKQQRARRG